MEPPLSSAAVRVVALGDGAELPSMMRGIAEACSPRGWSWLPSDDHDRLSGASFGGHGDSGAPWLGRLVLSPGNAPGGDSRWTIESVGDPSARQAIAAADLIVLGPGSLHGTLLPVLRLPEVAEEIGRSRARVVLVMSLMTEPGSLDGYAASDWVRAIRQHAPEVILHDVLLNDSPIRSDRVVTYARYGAWPIGYDTEALETLGCRPLKCDLLWDGPVVRHDPRKMGRAILGLAADLEARGARSVSAAGRD